mgnify:CR=1 FL=1
MAGHGQAVDPVTGRIAGPYGTNGLSNAVETADTYAAQASYPVAESPADSDSTYDFQDVDSDGDPEIIAIKSGAMVAAMIAGGELFRTFDLSINLLHPDDAGGMGSFGTALILGVLATTSMLIPKSLLVISGCFSTRVIS